MTRNKTKRPRKLKPMQIAMVALVVLLFFNCCIFIAAILDWSNDYKTTEENMLYGLQAENYVWLRDDLADYTAEEIEKSTTLRECYAISLYFDHSVFHHACVNANLPQADTYFALMQEDAKSAGELSFYLSKIDSLFE